MPTSTASQVPTSAAQSITTTSCHYDWESCEVDFSDKGVVDLLHSKPDNLSPTSSAVLSLISKDGCSQFPLIVLESEKFISSKFPLCDPVWGKFSQDEILALVIYGWDLEFATKEQNFYFVLNTVLQERKYSILKLLSSYMYWLQSGFSKLDNYVGTVYRGVPPNIADKVSKKYTQNTRIQWSSYSLTTTDLSVALSFAGANGIVLEITISTGKSLKKFSKFSSEEDILLSPNMVFIVSKSVHEFNASTRIQLIQQSPQSLFVY